MTNDAKYDKMRKLCKRYQEQIEQLKNDVYGYTISLDCVSPQQMNIWESPVNNEFLGFEIFVDKIIGYYKGFTKQTASCFETPATEEDTNLIRTMLTCIFAYMKYECPHNDYTFLGLTKILSTFLGSVSLEETTNLEKSTFWFMYDDVENKEQFTKDIQNTYHHFFEAFDYNRYSRIADGIFYSVRFFLFDNNLDYLSDMVMRISTMDMLNEIKKRLETIYFNRQSSNFEEF